MTDNNKREKCMSTIIRVTVLSWSAALLTASYAGLLAKMDPTFIATVFTAAAATFGVDTLKKGDKDDEEKPVTRTPEPEFVIEPEPIVEPVVATTVAETEPCPTCGDSPDYTTRA
jgi:hypothetical protein